MTVYCAEEQGRYKLEVQKKQNERILQRDLAERIKKGEYNIKKNQTKRQTKKANDGRVAPGTLRPFILITLGHTERREIREEQVAERIRKLFQCCAIVITKEKHQEGGWHMHVAIKNKTASKNNATSRIREAFKEFEGKQCNVTFHKGLTNMIGYVTKEDKEPYVWGEFTKDEILEMGQRARNKKKANIKPVKEILQKIKECQEWMEVYEHIEIVERILYGSYSNMKRVYQDIQIMKEKEGTPIGRIQRYLDERQVEKKGIQEYSPEELQEKYPLIDWIACNIICKRPLKTKQLLLYGPPSTQKTLIFDKLRKAIRIYFAGERMNDFAGADDYYDLWVFDEFHNFERTDSMGETIYSENANVFNNTMLKIMDGQECRLDAKYGEVIHKKRNVPIVLIANRIPQKIRNDGPMQERIMRLRYQSTIKNIEDEKLVLTLKGCILRRMQQKGEEDIEIKYNKEKANAEKTIKKEEGGKIIERFNARTEEGRELKIAWERKATKNQKEKEATVTITIDENELTKGEMSVIKYAAIPIKKISTTRKKQEITIKAFKAEQPGENFKIIRNNGNEIGDYMTWPIKVSIEEKKEKRNAEIIITKEKRGKQKNKKIERKIKMEEKISIGIGTKAKRKTIGIYSQQEKDDWDKEEWNEND